MNDDRDIKKNWIKKHPDDIVLCILFLLWLLVLLCGLYFGD